MADQERPGAKPQRKKEKPWVFHRGVKRQWLNVTVWHGEEEFPARFPLGVKEVSEVSEKRTKSPTLVWWFDGFAAGAEEAYLCKCQSNLHFLGIFRRSCSVKSLP